MAGSLIKIDEEIVTSAVASVTLGGADWDSSYDVYMVSIVGMTCSSGSQLMNYRVLVSGTPDTSANYDRATKNLRTDTTFSNRFATNETSTRIFSNPDIDEVGSNATLYLFNYNNASEYSFLTMEPVVKHNSNILESPQGGAVHTVAQACNGVQFFMSSGNITSGTFKLYALKK